MPSSRFYCEKHISRGCSCMTDDNGDPMKDSEGRELPCVEYEFSSKGYRIYKDSENY